MANDEELTRKTRFSDLVRDADDSANLPILDHLGAADTVDDYMAAEAAKMRDFASGTSNASTFNDLARSVGGGIDLADLARWGDVEEAIIPKSVLEDFSAGSVAQEAYQKSLISDSLSDAVTEASGLTSGLSELDSYRTALGGTAEFARIALADNLTGNITADLHAKLLGFSSLSDYDHRSRMEAFAESLKPDSTLAQVVKDIEYKQTLIDALGDTGEAAKPSYPAPEFFLPKPDTTMVDIKDGLARIEKQFGLVSNVVKASANVAAGLELSAAQFLQKFETEADKNSVSVKKTISVARWSLLVVVLVAIAQIFVPPFLSKGSSEALQQSVIDLQEEVTILRESQAAASDRLVEALTQSGEETTTALRAIAEQLVQPAPKAVAPPEPILDRSE